MVTRLSLTKQCSQGVEKWDGIREVGLATLKTIKKKKKKKKRMLIGAQGVLFASVLLSDTKRRRYQCKRTLQLLHEPKASKKNVVSQSAKEDELRVGERENGKMSGYRSIIKVKYIRMNENNDKNRFHNHERKVDVDKLLQSRFRAEDLTSLEFFFTVSSLEFFF